jgi:hypothetical protein
VNATEDIPMFAPMLAMKRIGALAAVIGLVALGVTAMPGKAEAWWRGGWCCGVGIGVYVPPLVIAPPVYYAPPPVAYAPPPAYYAPPQPQRQWVPGHYEGGYWVPGHWV